MYNPNTKDLSLASKKSLGPIMRVVRIGKDSQPVNLTVTSTVNSHSGLQHPYDKERDFLSRFPVGFEGCYNCGQKDHRNTRDCTKAKNGNVDA